MILKVASEVENAAYSWRIFDKVEGLHYTLYDDYTAFKKEHASWALPSEVQELWYDYEKGLVANTRPVLFISFHSETTGAIHIICATQCYLLNDNGKTIERLI